MKKRIFRLFSFCIVCLLLGCNQTLENTDNHTVVVKKTASGDFFTDDLDAYLDTLDKNTIQYKLCRYVHDNGRTFAPDYYQTDCSEFMTVLLSKFYNLSNKDIRQINIDIRDEADKENFWFYVNGYSAKFGQELLKLNVSFPNNHHNELMIDNQIMRVVWLAKGAGGFVEKKKTGYAVNVENAKAGDLVQIWYPGLYGHCGVVKYIDQKHKKIVMYSSFPSTGGFGVQSFDYHHNMLAFFTRIEKIEKQP